MTAYLASLPALALSLWPVWCGLAGAAVVRLGGVLATILDRG